MENIKIEEKIDFIYKRLKKEEKKEKIFLFIKVFYYCSIILIIFFSYFYLINKINNLKNSINSLDPKNITENIKERGRNFIDFTSEKINNFKIQKKNKIFYLMICMGRNLFMKMKQLFNYHNYMMWTCFYMSNCSFLRYRFFI